MHRSIFSIHCHGLFFLFLIAVLFSSLVVWAGPPRVSEGPDRGESQWWPPGTSPFTVYALDVRGGGQEDGHLRERYERWQTLSPAEKEVLRRRMDQLKQMSPEDRQRHKHRFEQWRSLSPEEQEQIHEKLNSWKSLPPDEKEQIRKRFRQ